MAVITQRGSPFARRRRALQHAETVRSSMPQAQAPGTHRSSSSAWFRDHVHRSARESACSRAAFAAVAPVIIVSRNASARARRSDEVLLRQLSVGAMTPPGVIIHPTSAHSETIACGSDVTLSRRFIGCAVHIAEISATAFSGRGQLERRTRRAARESLGAQPRAPCGRRRIGAPQQDARWKKKNPRRSAAVASDGTVRASRWCPPAGSGPRTVHAAIDRPARAGRPGGRQTDSGGSSDSGWNTSAR